MRKLFPKLLIWLCLVSVCMAGMRDKILLVKVTDRGKEEELRIMTSAEFKALESEIKKELKVFRKALMLAEKAWKADGATKKKRFPKAAISPRRIKIAGTFTDMQKAQDKLARHEEREAFKEEMRMEREEEKKKQRKATFGKGKRAKKMAEKREKELLGKIAVREALYESARIVFEAKLDELLNPGGTVREKAAAE